MAVSLDHVIDRINEDQVGKADYITPMSNLHVDRLTGDLAFKRTLGDVMVEAEVDTPTLRDMPFAASDWAEGQLLSKLGMPRDYFRKIKEAGAVDMFADHFNYWAGKDDRMIRLRAKVSDPAGSYQQGLIRGAVSDRYSVLDNDFIIEALKGILKGYTGDYQIEAFHLDDRRMHLRITYNDLTAQLGETAGGEADFSKIGTDIVNSEVGASSFNLQALIWRLICSNGLRGWGNDGDAYTQRHINLRPDEFQERVARGLVNTVKSGEGFLNEYNMARAHQVQNPFNVIKKLAAEGGYSKQFADSAVNEFEFDDTRYGVVNAFTRAARELPNERRLDAEKFAGKLLTLPSSRWENVDNEEELEEATI